MALLTLEAAKREGLIVDCRNADGLHGPGGKLFPIPELARRLVDRLGFFEIFSRTSTNSVSGHISYFRSE